MKNGIISLDTPRAKQFGFTSGKFMGWLWKSDGYIIISMIQSLKGNQGNLSNLFENILNKGYGIKVPTPLGKMQSILEIKKFKQTYEYWKEMGEDIEIWVKDGIKNGI